ncbi:synapse-associated protein 1-like isoform 2-T6 [Aulostomus maculatus]
MFKHLGAWLGIEKEIGQQESESVGEDMIHEINKPTESEQIVEKGVQPPHLLQKAKGLSGYVYNIASSASKIVSESVIETAQTLKKTVEEGNINGIIDKTILGDFQKEQEKFVQEKNAKKLGAAVPPWVGFNEEDTVQQQILSLSLDKRNFLRDPPAGVQFHFDFEQMYPVAMVMLEEDELLRKMRFHLVPKQVKEEAFWRNYFYRVSLIKQSAQLTALAAHQAAGWRDNGKPVSSQDDGLHEDVAKQQPPAAISSSKPKISEDEEEIPASPQEMADWERELQAELREYDVLADNERCDDNCDREIEEMLKEDS